MRVKKVSQTGVGSSNFIQVVSDVPFFSVNLRAFLTGTATFSIENTLDDVSAPDFNASTASWLPLAAASANRTVSTTSFLTAPARGCRVTILSGTGTVDLTVCQAGIG